MAAYVILDINVVDAARYEDYKRLASASIAKHGGKYLVRGGKQEPLEGSFTFDRVVVLEFESAATRFAIGAKNARKMCDIESIRKTRSTGLSPAAVCLVGMCFDHRETSMKFQVR